MPEPLFMDGKYVKYFFCTSETPGAIKAEFSKQLFDEAIIPSFGLKDVEKYLKRYAPSARPKDVDLQTEFSKKVKAISL